MAGQQHKLIRLFAADDVTKDILRGVLAVPVAAQLELDGHRLVSLQHIVQQNGIRHRKRRSGHARLFGRNLHDARVRQPVVVRGNGTNQHGLAAFFRRQL